MKKAVIYGILCFLALGCGKEEVEKTEKKPVQPYTIDFPESWKVEPDVAEGRLLVGYPVPKQRMPCVGIRKMFFSGERGFEWYVKDHIGYHTNELKATILEQADDTIGGLPAVRVSASFQIGKPVVINTVFFVDAGDMGYSISCDMYQNDYRKYAEELIKAARTFKVSKAQEEEEEEEE